ncbi:MAG: tRNA(fMet)-specific endonuclease VapC [Chloroflexi bacterium ADurb.Bin360]|nr:MAG: tRNA(fMet)-specific endonuclease VapC [Chloroflexi bacterium ADurb.Bin360]
MRILDSDHCVALLRGRLNLTGRVPATEELATTTVSVGELVHGAHKSARVAQNLSSLEVLLATLRLLPYDAEAARCFGYLKAELERRGLIIGELDLQVSAIALSYQVPLVTHNTRHFDRIPGLLLEDWLL